MEDAVNVSTAKDSGDIVVAGAGYARLHVALRLTAKLRNNPGVELTLVDRHDYHQVLTELPRVAGGTRAADAVRIPLQDLLAKRVRFIRTEISGFDLADRQLLTEVGPISWWRLVLALGRLAQVALEEGETAARNLDAELTGRPLEAFTFHDKGFVVSVGARRGVADIAGITSGGQLAHLLKDAIEWEYRQSVSHLRGWDPVAR
jgi:NADH dehydrogenase FAD-containing subunit